MAITDGLIHYWLLGETNGTRADGVGSDDLSPISTDADSVEGNLGQAADMTGDLVALQVGSDIDLSAVETFSCSLWFYQGELPDGNRRLIYLARGSQFVFRVSVNSSVNRPFGQLLLNPSGNFGIVPPEGREILNFRWNHVVITYERNEVGRNYLNGSLAQEVEAPDEPLESVTSSETFTIGSNQLGNDGCDCLVQRVMIWNRAITASEVTELFNFGTSIYNESPLLTTHAQTELARREVMENGYEGVVVTRQGIDSFTWFDRRVIGEARGGRKFRGQIGPMSGNWRALRAYLDPRGTVLSETPS